MKSISYEEFIKLTDKEKYKLMTEYNDNYYKRFVFNVDGTITVKDKLGGTLTDRGTIKDITCPDFWKPDQAYDYIEYCHWRLKGCGDEEAMCKAMCD